MATAPTPYHQVTIDGIADFLKTREQLPNPVAAGIPVLGGFMV